MPSLRRNITFVTGTRAEFGLMTPVLRAIQADRRLNLQIVATGMHLDRAHGRTIDQIKADGWKIDATVPWKSAGANKTLLARQTGLVSAAVATAYEKLKSDIVLVVGDRVEAFAAASAAHLSGRILAHVHGGDRALGQVDDALRHAISKLAHIHFAVTQDSADRLLKMGEDKWRIKLVGSPGIDGIASEAWSLSQCVDFLKQVNDRSLLSTGGCFDPRTLTARHFALLILHPTQGDDIAEHERAEALLHAAFATPIPQLLIVYPNNDPGAGGILSAWRQTQYAKYRALPSVLARRAFITHLPRPAFLGLLRDAAVLIGNSSSGIIEAASFGTPVIDIGDRQKGRLRGENVTTVPFSKAAITRALKKIWNDGKPLRYPRQNPYGRGRTGLSIARHLGSLDFNDNWRQKLIAY